MSFQFDPETINNIDEQSNRSINRHGHVTENLPSSGQESIQLLNIGPEGEKL